MKKNKSSVSLTIISLASIILVSIFIYYIIGYSYINKINKTLVVGLEGVDFNDGFDIESLAQCDIIIPERITNIQKSIKSNEAISITVSEENEIYYSVNNCVLEKKTNNLVLGCINSVIPKETKSIDRDAFDHIVGSSNSAIYYEGTLEEWLDIKFENQSPGYYFDRVVFLDENKDPYEIEKIVFPDNYYFVPDYKFYNFKNVKEIDFNDVQTIGDYAFANCALITNLYLPDTIVKIGTAAFQGLDKLEKISVSFVGLEQNSEYHYFGNIFSKGLVSSNSHIPESLTEVVVRNDNSIEENAFSGCANIKSIEFYDKLKFIGDKAFSHCSKLEKLVLPSTIEKIGFHVLSDSNTLNVYYQNTFEHFLNVFYGSNHSNNDFLCNNFYELNSGEYRIVTEIKMDNKISEIEDSYFKALPFLKVIYFGSNIKAIGAAAFDNLNDLEAVYFDGTIEDWLNIKFKSLSSNPKYLCDYVFIKNNKDEYVLFEDFYFPDNITKINAYSLVNFKNREELIIPDTVTSIGKHAFYGMENVKKVVTPFLGSNREEFVGLSYLFGIVTSELQYLDVYNAMTINLNNLLLNETKIETFIFGNNTVQIDGHFPFYENTTLKEVYFCNDINGFLKVINVTCFTTTNNENLKFYLYQSGEFVDFNDVTTPCIISKDDLAKLRCFKNVKEITLYDKSKTLNRIESEIFEQFEIIKIDDEITTITEKALNCFSNIKELYIPNSVVNINEMAFSSLKKLEKVEFAAGMKIDSIPRACFNACESLKDINIPSSVLSIEPWAFTGCYKLENVVFENDSKLTFIYLKAFCACTSLKEFYIPKSVAYIDLSAFDMCEDLTIYCPHAKENCSYINSIDKEFINVIWAYKE